MVRSDAPEDKMEEDDVVEELYDDDIAEEIPDDLEVEESQDDFEGFDEDMDHTSALPARDDADLVFKEHSAPVFCCDINPRVGNLAITGGQDDRGLVWDIKTGDIVFECTGHKDSVVEASFSHDGVYAVTGDLGGLTQVWQIATKSLVWCENIGLITWVKWHHGAHVLLAAASSGEVYLWKVPSGECKMLPSHGSSSNCGAFMPDGKRAVIGYTDGSVKVFDLKSGTAVGNLAPSEAQASAILCINVHHDNTLVVAGSADGKVMLMKSQPVKVISVFDVRNADVKDDEQLSVESVAFCWDPMLPLVAAGTMFGYLYIWDIAKQSVRHRLNLNEGITKLVWDRNSAFLYSAHLGGTIRAHDPRSGVCQFELTGHSDDILDITLSLDGNTILTTSDDSTARVFSVNNPDR